MGGASVTFSSQNYPLGYKKAQGLSMYIYIYLFIHTWASNQVGVVVQSAI